jgi:hypothetical protein
LLIIKTSTKQIFHPVSEGLKERGISEMKKIFLGVLVGTLILGTVIVAMAGPFTRRETRQQARICQGVGNGQVTPWEFRHLERQQGRIEAYRGHAWSDGSLNRWEGRHLTRMQNRASRDIWRAKHNRFHY